MNSARIKAGSGRYAWVGLVAGVAVYDTWALIKDGTTLSSTFANGVRNPYWRWFVVTGWAITTLHLFGLVPRRFDPYHGYGILLYRMGQVKKRFL